MFDQLLEARNVLIAGITTQHAGGKLPQELGGSVIDLNT